MEKEEIIKIVDGLHQDALNAAMYMSLMKQYSKYLKEYHKELSVSPAFYNVMYGGLQLACFIEVAKLFDSSNDAISIRKLINICKENVDLFSEYRCISEAEHCGQKYTHKFKYQYILKEEDKRFFKEKVEKQTINNENMNKIFNLKRNEIQVDLSFSEFLEFFIKKYRSFNKKIKYVRYQRGKMYAHNDQKGLLNPDEIYKNNPLTVQDVESLIEFAHEVINLVSEALTGKGKARKYANIDDFQYTLEMVRMGLQYKNEYYKLKHMINI